MNDSMTDSPYSQPGDEHETAAGTTSAMNPDMEHHEEEQRYLSGNLGETDLGELQAAASEFNAAFSTALYEIESSRKQVQERSARIEELNTAIEEINASLGKATRKIDQLEASYEHDTTELNRQIEALQSDRSRLEQQTLEQSNDLQTRNNEIESLNLRITELDGEVARVSQDGQRALDEFTSEKDRLTGLLYDLQNRYNSTESQLAERTEELADRESRIAELRGQADSLNTELNAGKDEIARLNMQLDELHEQFDSMVSQLQYKQEEVQQRDTAISGLQNQNEQLSSEIRQLEDEVQQRDTAISGLQNQVEQLSSEIRQLEDEVQQRDTTISGLHNQVEQLSSEIRLREDEVQQRDTTISGLHHENERLSSVIQERKQEVSQLNNQIESITGEVESLRSYSAELSAHAEKLETLNQAMHESTISENTVHKKALQEKNREIERLRLSLESNASSTVNLADFSGEISTLQSDLEHMEAELQAARNKNAELESAEAKTTQLEQEISDLRTELEASRLMQDESTTHSGHVADLQSQLQQLTGELEQAHNEVTALTCQLQEKASLEQEVAALRESSEHVAAAGSTIEHLTGQIEQLQAALAEKEYQYEQLEQSASFATVTTLDVDESAPATQPAASLNRAGFIVSLDKLLTENVPGNSNAVMYVLLDNFAQIRNDIGIMNSEHVIAEVANIISSTCDDHDMVARFGDSTFVVLSRDENPDQTKEKANRIRASVESSIFDGSGHTLLTTTSIGICSVRSSDDDAEAVINRAELACEAARSSGGNQVLASSSIADQMISDGGDEFNEEMVIQTLDEDRIKTYYQPISSLQDNQGNHYEVLIRIVDESGNIILPGEFFSMAASTGHAVDIDLHVIENIMKMLSESRNREMKLFIKLTRQSVADHELPMWIIGKIKEYGINAEQLVFEVAENILQNELKNLSMLSNALNKIGCKVAIEHYRMSTQPQHLQHIHADYLKIDSSLVETISSKGESLAKVKSIIEVARKHNYITIAEGVESPACLAILWELGASLAQGYFIQAPTSDLDYDFQGIVSESDSGNKATFTIT